MRKISKSIDISARVDRVFDFITHPINLLSVWPSLVEVTNIEWRDDGWHSFDWVYKMVGMRFHGKAKTVRVEPTAYLEMKNESGIPSIFRWKYQARDGSTRLLLEVEYTIPAPVLGTIAETIVAKMNDHEMDALLANLKATLDVAPKPKAVSLVEHRSQ